MKISIIVPALNEADRIAHAIEDAWTISPHEVVVVDGGSEDGTADVARTRDCRLLISSPGRAVQQNLGASESTGDVLLFLHADCSLHPDCRRQLATALKDPRVVGGAFRQRIDARGAAYRCLEFGNALRVKLWKLAYGDQAIFIHREWFEALGGFPDVPLMEDLLLMRRLRGHGRFQLLPGPVSVSPRRWQRYGVVRQTLKNWSLLAGEKLGVPVDRLAQFYQPNGTAHESSPKAPAGRK